MLLICRLDRMVGTNARYIEVAATDMNRLATSPVFADPACSLAKKRVAQNGMTPASRMKWLERSLMFPQIPNSSRETLLVIIRTKASPVATLRMLDANTISPEYLSLMSLLTMRFTAYRLVRFLNRVL